MSQDTFKLQLFSNNNEEYVSYSIVLVGSVAVQFCAVGRSACVPVGRIA